MRAFVVAILLALSGGPAASQTLQVEDAFAWVSPGARSASAYFRLENSGESDRRIVGVSSAEAKRAELHEFAEDADGTARMARVESGVTAPAGATVVFEPGGLHVMFMGLESDPDVGETLTFRLRLDDDGEIEIGAIVRPRGEAGHSGKH